MGSNQAFMSAAPVPSCRCRARTASNPRPAQGVTGNVVDDLSPLGFRLIEAAHVFVDDGQVVAGLETGQALIDAGQMPFFGERLQDLQIRRPSASRSRPK